MTKLHIELAVFVDDQPPDLYEGGLDIDNHAEVSDLIRVDLHNGAWTVNFPVVRQ